MTDGPIIRMHIRFPGDPPPDPRDFGDPVTIPGWAAWKMVPADTRAPPVRNPKG